MTELPIRWYKYNQDSGKFEPMTTEPPQNIPEGGDGIEIKIGGLSRIEMVEERFEPIGLNRRQLEQVRAIVQEELVKAGLIQVGFKTAPRR